MSYNSLLAHRCTIQRPTYGAVDGHGVPTKTWATLATNVHCRYEWQGKSENTNDKMAVMGSWKLYLPKAQDIREDDRITNIVDTFGTAVDAGPFDVTQINSYTSYHKHHHKSCSLRHAEEGGTSW